MGNVHTERLSLFMGFSRGFEIFAFDFRAPPFRAGLFFLQRHLHGLGLQKMTPCFVLRGIISNRVTGRATVAVRGGDQCLFKRFERQGFVNHASGALLVDTGVGAIRFSHA